MEEQSFNNVTTASTAASKVTQLVDMVKAFSPSNNVVMVVVIVTGLLLSVYVGYYLYTIFMKTNLETVTLLKAPVKVPKSSIKLINSNTELPVLRNGTEYAYSFWMYLNSFEKNTDPQMILFGGSSTLDTDTPVFFLDGDYVKLNASVKTNSEITECSNAVLSVDYIPRQRWVNVCLVVDNEFVQLFVDGELRKVLDTSEKTADVPCENRLVNKRSENLYTGKIDGYSVIDGYLSKVQFFNYALTIDHVSMLYKSGPLYQNILTRIGVPMYGVRNPFYRIDDISDTDEK